jgi:oxygen-independent coproporphyrinogen-3 oxidase
VETGAGAAPDDDEAAALYETAIGRLAEAGYVHYEVSNWARTGAQPLDDTANPAFASRHNLLYWRNQEYVVVGPGAHSHLRGCQTSELPAISRRWGNRKPVPSYARRMAAGQPVVDFQEELATDVSMGETMMLGLRLVREGVPFDRFESMHGIAPNAIYTEELARLAAWGVVELDEKRVRLTRRGLMVGNQVFATFLGHWSFANPLGEARGDYASGAND